MRLCFLKIVYIIILINGLTKYINSSPLIVAFVVLQGNNRISGSLPASLGNLKNLQRIVLHQNRLSGHVPDTIWKLGCIVRVYNRNMIMLINGGDALRIG